ncbi:MAG: DUF4260 domain-containing protein [Bryobacteraceae bacterium]
MLTNPRVLLLVEGAAVLAVSVLLYSRLQGEWRRFALLFFVPDLSMLGYAVNSRFGAAAYNAVYSMVAPLALSAWARAAGHDTWLPLLLIWVAHLGFDRMLGFGLKFPNGFRRTHLEPGRYRTTG